MTRGTDQPRTGDRIAALTRRVAEILPVACQQCLNPACVKVCPVKATWQDATSGEEA